MPKEHRLFEHIIDPNRDESLVDQVRHALVEEIRRGRWEIGARLPSISVLVRQTGLSRWPVQRAFETLRAQGYLRQESRSGTFLASRDPSGGKGTIGIVLPMSRTDEGWSSPEVSHHRLGYLLEAAARRGYETDIRFLKTDDQWSEVDRAGALFPPETFGVVSLHCFDHPNPYSLADDRLPFVHCGPTNDECLPVVCGDMVDATYRVTKKVTEAGHRRILLCLSPERSSRQHRDCLEGYGRAMEEAGLDPDRDAARESLGIRREAWEAARDFLASRPETTAIVNMSFPLAHMILPTIERLGLRIPEDISVVGWMHPVWLAEHNLRPSHSLVFSDPMEANMCLDILENQRRDRRSVFNHLMLRAELLDGDTLVSPRDALSVAGKSAGERQPTSSSSLSASDRSPTGKTF